MSRTAIWSRPEYDSTRPSTRTVSPSANRAPSTLTSFQTTPGTRPVRSASSTLRNGSPLRVRRVCLRWTAKVASITTPSLRSAT